MLKKLLKAALTACVVVGMSSTAMAWAPIGNTGLMFGASSTASFGQYNTGIEDESAYLTGKQETHFSWYGTAGKWSAWADIEYDDHPQMHNSTTSAAKTSCSTNAVDGSGDPAVCSVVVGKEIDALVAYINYAISPQMSVRIGNIHHLAGLQYSNDGEMFAYVVGHAGWNYAGYSEAPGIALYYTISPEMKVQLSYYTQYAAEMTGRAEGTAQALDFDGKISGIDFHIGYISELESDHTDKDAEFDPNVFTNLGVIYPINEAMAVVFDYTTAALTYGSKTHKENVTDMSLQFRMTGLGPGGIYFTYSPITGEDPDKAYTVTGGNGYAFYKWSQTDMSLAYEIKAGPGAMQFQYATSTFKGTTPAEVESDAVTKTWMGVAYKFAL
jgi:hypothetical protein